MTVETPMRSRSVKYTTGEIGRVRVVEDFLPVPKALVPFSRGNVASSKRVIKARRLNYRRMDKAWRYEIF